MSKKFNIDKLNLDKIKKEIVSVPNLIKKKAKLDFVQVHLLIIVDIMILYQKNQIIISH